MCVSNSELPSIKSNMFFFFYLLFTKNLRNILLGHECQPFIAKQNTVNYLGSVSGGLLVAVTDVGVHMGPQQPVPAHLQAGVNIFLEKNKLRVQAEKGVEFA